MKQDQNNQKLTEEINQILEGTDQVSEQVLENIQKIQQAKPQTEDACWHM